MFVRKHRLGRHLYIEALESYRDADGRPRHRCIARWRAERSLAEEIGCTQFEIARATRSVAYSQGVIDGTVQARSWKHHKHVRQWVKDGQRHLDIATARLAVLTAAREAGVPADDADIERAVQARAEEWGEPARRLEAGPPNDLTAIAERVRRLATQNDPDALRAEAVSIAAALDALTA